MHVELSKRLQVVASYIPKGARLVDVGSDHAYVPIYALQQNLASFAIAGEVVKGPFESAQQNIEKYNLSKKIEARLGSGLSVIQQEDEMDTLTIAGMGGQLIAQLLTEGVEQLHTMKRLILQPNVDSHLVRQWLMAHSFLIIDEQIIKEDDKIYEIIVAERGQASYSEVEQWMGPYLVRACSPVFIERWTYELEGRRRIVAGLAKAKQTETTALKQKEIERQMKWIEEVIQHGFNATND
ncbi:MAG TPA: tRNA (adenine(22)-N(1))-methyltransferase TrmK [Savagea sp.]